MSVIFKRKIGQVEYQVKKHGQRVCLFTDEVFHSEYHPKKILTGSVWDMMLLPAFFKARPPKNVLLLGLGGGVLVHQLKHFFPGVQVTAIEIDKTHIQIAKKYFAVDYPDVELIHADAIAWLKHYRGKQFDLVIDDLFSADAEGLASRVKRVDRDWWFQLQSRVREQGQLVINFACQQELQQSCFYRNPVFADYLQGRYVFQTADCENRIACLSASKLDLLALNQRIQQQPLLAKARKSGQLKYTVRPLPAA